MEALQLRSQDENNMVRNLPIGGGLRYNEKDIDPGAQTERRGDTRPVRALLGGGTSPATLLQYRAAA
jgi:hypothetical protein